MRQTGPQVGAGGVTGSIAKTSWTPVRSGHCILGYHHWQIPERKDSGVYQDVEHVVKGMNVHLWHLRQFGQGQEAVARRADHRVASGIDRGREPQTVASKLYKVADLPPDDWQKLTVSGAPVQ